MANKYKIRAATPIDAAIIADFNIAMALETERLSLDRATVTQGVAAGIGDDTKAKYFVAELAGETVGCCMVTHEWSDWRNGDIWWFQSVYVRPDCRRRGVFAALYAYVESAARGAPAVALRLYVERDNVNAKKTYGALGMSLTHYDVMERKL